MCRSGSGPIRRRLRRFGRRRLGGCFGRGGRRRRLGGCFGRGGRGRGRPGGPVTAWAALTSGETTITLDPHAGGALAAAGVTASAYGTAKLENATLTLPVTSGYLEVAGGVAHQSRWIQGSVVHDGSGLTLTGASASVTASDLLVEPGGGTVLATIGGKAAFPLFSVATGSLTVATGGHGVSIGGATLRLTTEAAVALNGGLHIAALLPGEVVGTARLVASGTPATYTAAEELIPALAGVSVTIDLAPAMQTALRRLGLKTTPLGSATLTAGALSMPVSGGDVVARPDLAGAPGYLGGVVVSAESGIELAGPPATVTFANLVVGLGDSHLYGEIDGHPSAQPIADLGSVTYSRSRNGAYLDSAGGSLSASTAALLDRALRTTAFTPATPLGFVHIVASGGH